ncbi:MAG: hypothetical protein IJJ41_10130 [Clostridia bacterium]|nr:hypothetical protein [Clostridia bacterium]
MAKKTDFSNAESIYNYITAQSLPQQWQTPESLKRSYAATVAAADDYANAIHAQLRQYGNYQPVTKTSEYKRLVDMYNHDYIQSAAVAAAEAAKAAAAADAGKGNSYAKAASTQALSGHLAKRGSALPQLMAAASSAYQKNKEARRAGIQAMNTQQQKRSSALQALFESQLSGIRKETEGKRDAYDTLFDSLKNMYAHQYALENQTASGSSGGSGGRKSSGRKSSKKSSRKSSKKSSRQHLTYSQAIARYPKLIGIMTEREFSRTGSGGSYDDYINEMIEKYY